LLALALAVAAGRAQSPLNSPAPLGPPVPRRSLAENTLALESAARAHNLGFASIAADIYQQILAAPGADHGAITLALATALLDAGRSAEAEKALATMPEPRGAAWRLRAGLAAFQLNKRDEAQAAWDAIKEEELSAADRPWYWFLTGALWDTAAVPDLTKANEFYLKAEGAASTDMAKARFQLAAERVRLRAQGVTSEADIRKGLENYERNRGTTAGYEFARAYAVSLDLVGRKAEALAFLQPVLVNVPRQETEAWDKLRLVLGLIGDRNRNGTGRAALEQLLESGNSPERQRQALQLLADASTREPERSAYRSELNRLIAATPRHPIFESLLYYRAQQALNDKEFVQAERDANDLLSQFPVSPLRAHAYGLLTRSAWEQRRFRSVADNARKARAELPASAVKGRFDLGVVEAEAWFRAGLNAGASGPADFRSAADAYAAILREPPPGLEPKELGALIFQRVLAEIKSGSGEGAKLLDQLKSDPAFDLEHRWQAEWQLAQHLTLTGKITEAYGRITRLLAEAPETIPAGAEALKPELRARMAWLQTKLSFEASEHQRTLDHADALLAGTVELAPDTKNELLSDVMLIKAQAELALGREPAALETLKRLRGEYAKSVATVQSYMLEAAYYESLGRIVDAQRVLTNLINSDDHKHSEYLPHALFQLAQLLERLGRTENLVEANKRIEDLVNLPIAANQPGLIFLARLKQGDVFRTLMDFPSAERAYEEVINRFPSHPDITVAHLRFAITLSAQAATNPDNGEKARRKFEELCDRADAPLDVQVQAGYRLGLLLKERGEEAKAADVWWRDVIERFLIKSDRPIEAAAKRPYWLARTLNELGELYEKQGRLEEAKRAWRLVLESNLGSVEAARKKLEEYGVPTRAL
jgi:TolA-binding protein